MRSRRCRHCWLLYGPSDTALFMAAVVLLLAWVILFSLAAYFIENDYVIWTPLVIYAAHCSLIIILIAVHTARRIRGMWKDKTSKTGNSPPTE